MSTWATRRKSIYLAVATIALASVSFLVFWKFWYVAPTCSNGLRDGDEAGIDCGGACPLVCSDSVFQPIVRWDPRLFEVIPGTWSALVYVENPNVDTDAIYASYTFTIFGDANEILAQREGATILPKNKTVGIFEGSIVVEDKKRPKRALFELKKNIVWAKNILQPPELEITHTPLLRLSSAPRVEANVLNKSIEDLTNIELVIAVFDGSDNTVAASRTFIESLKKNENADIFFTWPQPFNLGSKICKKPSQIMLLLDRSGSMASIGSDPPEPLTTAKAAASSFIEQLGANDRVGLTSFATEASLPIELSLTSNLSEAKEAVGSIVIEEGATQYTNIFGAINSAWQTLSIEQSDPDTSKIIVLLTDGVATNPKNPEGGTEEDDIKYAENLAIKTAQEAKQDDLIIYTIGLGNEINQTFLKTIASKEENYFFAPTALDLHTIYQNISSQICEEVPARIEITHKIFGDAL